METKDFNKNTQLKLFLLDKFVDVLKTPIPLDDENE